MLGSRPTRVGVTVPTRDATFDQPRPGGHVLAVCVPDCDAKACRPSSKDGADLSVHTIERILAVGSFSNLPRRPHLEVGMTVAGC